MNPAALVDQLESLGITIVADEGRLRVNAARGQLTDDLKQAIAAHKAELLEFFAARGMQKAQPLLPLARGGSLPTSYFQERLWVLNRLEPDSTAYNLVTVWWGDAAVDADRLAAAIASVVSRIEILRATFHEEGGSPVVRLLPPEAVPIVLHDLGSQAPEEQLQILRDAAKASAALPFDLANQPPARFAVYRLGTDRAATLVTMHHIAADAWSMGLLSDQVRDACMGRVATACALQYADYAAWQRKTQESHAISTELNWWQARLAGAPPLSVFPADRSASEVARATSAVHDFTWSAELSQGIRSMVRELGATVYMAMLAACATVLYRHTGQDDVVLGSPMGIRERPEFESMIGPFVNLLVVRLDLSDDPSFADLVKRARDAVLDVHAHRQVPFEKLLERLKPTRSLVHSPLFQMAIVQHNAPASDSGATPILGGGAIHELTWFVREVDGCLLGSIEYRSDLYSANFIQSIGMHMEVVLAAAVHGQARRLSELPLLSSQERDQVIRLFSTTAIPLDTSSVVRQFERQTALAPQAAAIRFKGAELSYGELNGQANRLARYLRGLGIAPGSLVGLCLNRSLDLLVALLGVLKAGGTYVPLDPAFPADRLGYMLADSGAAVLVTAADVASEFAVPDGLRRVDLHAIAGALSRLDSGDLEDEPSPEVAAYVIYTSGSTGRPKGVAVSHGSLSNFLGSMRRAPGLAASDVLAAVTTISFDIAGLELYLPLIVGARIELVSQQTASDGAALASLLANCGITTLQATPATWRMLIEAGWRGGTEFRAFCGGEGLPRELADRLIERTSELWNLYGPTETTIWSTADRVVPGTGSVSIGRPIANTQVYVLDSAGEPVPAGIPGEAWIGGAGVAIGYHRRPDMTAERFVADPFAGRSGACMYRTGDLCRWLPDGRLEHLGRIDQQVKIRGFRIELGEIETILSTHEAVRQSVIIAREASPGDLRLIAYLVYHPGEDLTVSDVRRHLRRELPDYMIPSVVVALDAIPLTPNGKVDRSALPDPFKNAALPVVEYVPPSPGAEKMMADIWQEILQLERVGAEDNFFEIGGHSLLSLRVVTAVEKRTGRRMDPRTLFFQNLRQLAASFPVEAAAHSS